MNVAVFPGSFNPLHIGHKAIMDALVQKAGFERVYLIVSPKNPLKEGISPDSAQDRYDAAVRAVKANGMTDVLVDDIELCLPPSTLSPPWMHCAKGSRRTISPL